MPQPAPHELSKPVCFIGTLGVLIDEYWDLFTLSENRLVVSSRLSGFSAEL